MNTQSRMPVDPSKDVWIGLLELVRKPGSHTLAEHEVAYVNALALAADEEDFLHQITHELDELGVDIMKCENVGRHYRDFETPQARQGSLVELGEEVARTGEVRFTTWHVSKLNSSGS